MTSNCKRITVESDFKRFLQKNKIPSWLVYFLLCFVHGFLFFNGQLSFRCDFRWSDVKVPSVATLEFYYGFCGGPCVPWSFKLQKKSSQRLSKSIESRVLIDPQRIIKLRSVFSHCLY